MGPGAAGALAFQGLGLGILSLEFGVALDLKYTVQGLQLMRFSAMLGPG